MKYLVRHTTDIEFETIEEARAYRDEYPDDNIIIIVQKVDSEFKNPYKPIDPYGSHFDLNPNSAKEKK